MGKHVSGWTSGQKAAPQKNQQGWHVRWIFKFRVELIQVRPKQKIIYLPTYIFLNTGCDQNLLTLSHRNANTGLLLEIPADSDSLRLLAGNQETTNFDAPVVTKRVQLRCWWWWWSDETWNWYLWKLLLSPEFLKRSKQHKLETDLNIFSLHFNFRENICSLAK